MSRLFTTFEYLKFSITSKSWRKLHSPYLFLLFSYCRRPQPGEDHFASIEAQRSAYLASDEIVNQSVLGAASQFTRTQQVAVKKIARHALSKPFQCRWMSRLAKFHQPKTVLEFGTSLGITALYLQTGAPESTLITIEGNPGVADIAKQTFSSYGSHQIELWISSFDEWIRTASHPEHYDLIFLDGDHKSTSLIRYFEGLLPYTSENTIWIIDDIYWSRDMQSGWNDLCHRPEVTQTVNCFHFGLLWFRKDFIEKSHHKIRIPLF